MAEETLRGWTDGAIELEAGDSRMLSRKSIAAGRNFRLDRTGGITLRRGITARAIGLPNNKYRVFHFKNSSKEAILACDGKTIRVLENDIWVSIGTFTNTGAGASWAGGRQRAYVCNGIDRMKVVDYVAVWNVRDAGVIPPVPGTVVTSSGGAGASFGFWHAITYVDDRGFESNGSTLIVTSAKDGGTFTMNTFPVAPANMVYRRIYSTLRDSQKLYLVKQITVATVSTTYSAANYDRDSRYPMPDPLTEGFEHDVPPTGMVSIAEYSGYLFGLSLPGLESWCAFTISGEPEYWPQRFRFDLTAAYDTSSGKGFGLSRRGLQLWRETAASILRGNPQFNATPQAMLQESGLAATDAIVSLNGVVYALTQRGIISHDGQEMNELWHRLVKSSGLALTSSATSRVVAEARNTAVHFFFRNPDDISKVRNCFWDTKESRWFIDDLAVSTAITTSTTTVDFSSDSDISLHENVESGAQTIISGGSTTIIILSGSNSVKLIIGTAIKFVGFTTIYIVQAVTGQTVTLDQAAPVDTAAVEWIRGTQIANGVLTLYGGS